MDAGIQFNTLTVAALCLSNGFSASQKEKLTFEALHYHSEGLNSINSRLGDLAGRVSNGMLISVMAMATHSLSPSRVDGWCWELAQAGHSSAEECEDQWRLHLEAMRTLLADRGGVQSIDSEIAMRTWLYL